MLESLLGWASSLPPAALYLLIAVMAAVENVFPPFPSDVVIAFASFLVAQGANGTKLGVFATVWISNVGSAMLVYAVGRKYGAERVEKRLAGAQAARHDATVRKLFERYGLPAIFVSRFVPGVRAIVPAIAGALKLKAVPVTIMIGAASAIWYGMITIVAFRVGSNWEALKSMVGEYTTIAAIVGGVILVAGVLAWLVARKRRK
jgi:membrane protein DedA with SNARE-associated domain